MIRTSGKNGLLSSPAMVETLEGRELLSTTILHPAASAALAAAVATPVGGVTLHEQAGVSFTASVGTFVVLAPAPKLQASINWGDKTTSAGTITPVGPVNIDEIEFQVTGTHVYTATGTFPITTTVIQPGPTPTSLVKLITTIRSTAIVSGKVVSLSGAISGKYSLAPTAVTVGATYVFNGTGAVSPLGPVSGQGHATLPPLGATGNPTGTLTLTSIGATAAASGSVTLALTAPTQSSSGPFPTILTYTIIGGTGIFAGATGAGTIDVVLGPGNAFTFKFVSPVATPV
jgi:hypothetical protein